MPPEANETQLLISRVRSGDGEARDELAGRHYGKIRFYIRSRLGRALASRVEVDDLVQETYLRAFRDIDRFVTNDSGGFYIWLSTLARHVLADVARAARAGKRGSSKQRALDRSDWSRVGAAETGPRTRVEINEQQQLLEKAFLQLTPRYRRIIRLRQWEAKPAREVAAILGMTEQAVHAAYRRALQAWAAAIEPADHS